MNVSKQTQVKRRHLNDIDVLCRLLADDNNNSTKDEFSDFSTIESSRESSDVSRVDGSAESLAALALEESLLAAEVHALNSGAEECAADDEDLREFTRLERELRVAELRHCLESVRTQIKNKTAAPLADSESLGEEPPQTRPLTLYLPIAEELDLRSHVQALGHEIEALEPAIVVSRNSCRGYLQKRCSDNSWRKRFFLFDRKQRRLLYFGSERAFLRSQTPSGEVAFDAIRDVYCDVAKSQDNRHVFVVGSHQRAFVLAASTPEVMRVWVDVIVTGAQAYQRFF